VAGEPLERGRADAARRIVDHAAQCELVAQRGLLDERTNRADVRVRVEHECAAHVELGDLTAAVPTLAPGPTMQSRRTQ